MDNVIKNWRHVAAKMIGRKRQMTGYVLAKSHQDAILGLLLDIGTVATDPGPLLEELAGYEEADHAGGNYRPIKLRVSIEILEDPATDAKRLRIPLIARSAARMRGRASKAVQLQPNA